MELPTYFFIYGLKIYSFGIFLLLSFLVSVFVVWQEGKKDGFYEEKLFDLFVITAASALFFSRLFAVKDYSQFFDFSRVGFNIYGAWLGVVITPYILCKIWKWSVFRIFDILSLSASLGFAVSMLGFVALKKEFGYLFVFSTWIFLYAVLVRLRNSKIKSGLSFSVFLLLNAFLGIIFFRTPNNLPFYGMLVLVSVVNFYLRQRKEFMKTNLPENLINLLKLKLKSKDKRLAQEEMILVNEDPYLMSGRDVANSEVEDEAEEDRGKMLVDTKKKSIGGMRLQVRRALAKFKIGTYGICDVCKKPIDAARLKAYPEATTCLEHAK